MFNDKGAFLDIMDVTISITIKAKFKKFVIYKNNQYSKGLQISLGPNLYLMHDFSTATSISGSQTLLDSL